VCAQILMNTLPFYRIILLDERFIRPYFRTDQDLLDAKEPITPNFRRIFETDNMKDLEQIVRTAYEDAYKVRSLMILLINFIISLQIRTQIFFQFVSF